VLRNVRHDQPMTPPMFRIAADAVGADRITLDGPEGRHASDVRRLRPGEELWLTDGAGTRGVGTVAEVKRGQLEIDVSEWLFVESQSPRLIVFQALAKGGRDEAAVESMTEVGVDEVVGWSASRSIAKWTDRTQTKWQSAADAAAKQARRSWWPVVTGPVTTAEVATRVTATGVAIVLHEAATGALADIAFADAGEVLVVVGPEGGIADGELAQLVEAGAVPVRLGSTVLRSSTAGVAALSAICARTRWS
jgi:16S rRNA (uracil1498-N3)-methyltransferase